MLFSVILFWITVEWFGCEVFLWQICFNQGHRDQVHHWWPTMAHLLGSLLYDHTLWAHICQSSWSVSSNLKMGPILSNIVLLLNFVKFLLLISGFWFGLILSWYLVIVLLISGLQFGHMPSWYWVAGWFFHTLMGRHMFIGTTLDHSTWTHKCHNCHCCPKCHKCQELLICGMFLGRTYLASGMMFFMLLRDTWKNMEQKSFKDS